MIPHPSEVPMVDPDGSRSFYFFDIDDNLLFLPTRLYLWNAERQIEMPISSGEFAAIQNDISVKGKWQGLGDPQGRNLSRLPRSPRRS